MALSVFIYFAIVTVIVQASPLFKDVTVHDKLDELLERAQILQNTTRDKIDNELLLDNYISLIVNTTVQIKKDAKKDIIEDVDNMVNIINTIVTAADEEGIDVSGCVGDSIAIIESSGEDLKNYITVYTGEESDNGIQEMDNFMGACNRQISTINRCVLNIQKCKLEEGDVQAECYDDLLITLKTLEVDVPKKLNEIQTNSSIYYDTFERDMHTHVNIKLSDFYKANIRIVQAILDCIDNMFTTTTESPTTTVTPEVTTETTTESPTTTVTPESTTETTKPPTTTVTPEVTTETTQPPTTTVTPDVTTETQPPTTETTEAMTVTTTESPTTTEATTVTPTATTNSPTSGKTTETTTEMPPTRPTPRPPGPPSKDQVCLYEILTDLSLRFVCY